jgi:hypothetical protein
LLWLTLGMLHKQTIFKILYFDSFGISPPEKIKKYLLSSGKNIAWNSTQLQMNSSVLCGYYCIYVIINVNRGKDFYDILYSFKQIPCRLRMNWSNNLSKKLRNSYNAMKRLLREINISKNSF